MAKQKQETKSKEQKKTVKKDAVKEEEIKEAKTEVKQENAEKKEQLNDPYKKVLYPISTEKSIRLMESENKLIFRVSLDAKKSEIKKAIEDLFKVKVTDVRTVVSPKGHKRAYVRFSDETPAIDIATQLGMM